MTKCDQEQSMKRIAELLQEWRRPRRMIVEYSPKGSHESNGVVENAHYHLEGVLRTMRSDLMEKTGVNVNVKSLLAPWLVRHCAWSLTRFAISADGQTAFKRQRDKDLSWRNGMSLAKPSVAESRFESKPKWNLGGRQTACSWERWICPMRMNCRDTQGNRDDTIIQTNDGRSSVESRDSAHVCWSTVEPAWHHH